LTLPDRAAIYAVLLTGEAWGGILRFLRRRK